MNWLLNTLGTSIGKKLMMAVTGLSFIGFLVVHLAGNMTLYGGESMFNGYAEHIHGYGPLINAAEFVLLTLALIHITVGMVLFYQNLTSRPSRYQASRWAGGRTVGSATMPYTGILILAFLILHLLSFRFIDLEHTTIYDVVVSVFADPLYVVIYIAAMAIVALHISHGFWSLFQTLGANHPKYMPTIQVVGLAVSLIFGIGFGFIPVYISFMA
ncbi:MAG: succinate dehydrogenase cytochrome b subunit [Desulfobacterales bacterium]